MKVYQKQSKYVNATCTTCATVGYLFRKKNRKVVCGFFIQILTTIQKYYFFIQILTTNKNKYKEFQFITPTNKQTNKQTNNLNKHDLVAWTIEITKLAKCIFQVKVIFV